MFHCFYILLPILERIKRKDFFYESAPVDIYYLISNITLC
jgi:hypothetical protein